ncbi:MAG: MFS transporter [Candidatus Heimdallarchaeota archaeon]|nr:MFS transporter [Candidatus Heimdallarchaeota archaeon]MBY8995758.1 MFS transporter [Candidatus Heimdallarchaeota archaeon]
MSTTTKRNIALISLGAFIWSIFFAIQGQYLNDYLADLSNFSPLIISLMVSLVALTGAIASIIAGSVSDNLRSEFGRRKIFILIGGTSSTLLFFLFPLGKSIAVIVGLNVAMNIMNTAAFVCNNSLIPDVTTNRKLGKTNAIALLGTSLGTVVGFAIMLLKSSSNVFFAAGAICSLGFLIVGLFFQEPKADSQPKKWHVEIKNTFLLSNLKSEKNFFRFLISHFLLHVGINCYIPFLLIFLTQENNPASGEVIGLGLSLQNGQVLIIFTIMTVTSLLFTIPFGSLIDKTNNYKFLIISRTLFALTTGLFALTPVFRNSNPMLIGALFIIPFSIANTADIISRGALMHSLTPEGKRGQFIGLLYLVKTLAQIPGVIIGGLLAQFLQRGYQYSFLIGAIILIISIPFISSSSFKILNLKKLDEKLHQTHKG